MLDADPARRPRSSATWVGQLRRTTRPTLISLAHTVPPPPQPAPAQRKNPVRLHRVQFFFLLLILLVAIIAVATEHYARSTYYVGLKTHQVTIFKGRPGGVLWWQPTLAAETGVTTAEVEPYHLATLGAGGRESTLADAKAYVLRLQAEKLADTAVAAGPETAVTTIPPTTTIP
jgi:PPM family protein phosphatase